MKEAKINWPKTLEVNKRIKELRRAKGLTQNELAQLIGYTDRSSIAKIEQGLVDLPQSKIKQFADVFGVAPGELMGWDEEPEELGAVAADVLRDRDLLRLVQNYMTMSDADRATVCALVESLARKKKG